MCQNKIALSLHTSTEVLQDENNMQKALHAITYFKKGEVISKFCAGVTMSYATYLTVQVGPHTHITLQPEHLQYINHSCDPNVFFDTTSMELSALKDIEPGEELSFFYPSTEWDMAQPFVCNCKSDQCLQLVKGAAYLSKATLSRYQFTNFINEQLQPQKQKL
ncbi:MAG: SET domain-containing protein-lysine N-methyltransferase [Ferruginibacter sp.]